MGRNHGRCSRAAVFTIDDVPDDKSDQIRLALGEADPLHAILFDSIIFSPGLLLHLDCLHLLVAPLDVHSGHASVRQYQKLCLQQRIHAQPAVIVPSAVCDSEPGQMDLLRAQNHFANQDWRTADFGTRTKRRKTHTIQSTF